MNYHIFHLPQEVIFLVTNDLNFMRKGVCFTPWRCQIKCMTVKNRN